MANYYGKNIETMLSDAVAIGYGGTTADSTNMAFVGGKTNGGLWINVYAHTDISIATGEYWNIELQSFSSDTAASAIAPISTGNLGGNAITGGATAETNAHVYLLHKTSADGQLDFVAGDLICQMAIPDEMLNVLGHDYVQITNVTDKTDPGTDETIDAFVYTKV